MPSNTQDTNENVSLVTVQSRIMAHRENLGKLKAQQQDVTEQMAALETQRINIERAIHQTEGALFGLDGLVKSPQEPQQAQAQAPRAPKSNSHRAPKPVASVPQPIKNGAPSRDVAELAPEGNKPAEG